MQPTSVILIAIVVIATLVAAVFTIWRTSRMPRPGAKRGRRVLAHAGLVVACQLLAVSSLFLVVNRQYGFYSSWSDLFGVQTFSPAQVQTDGLDAGTGRIETLDIHGDVSHVNGQALVWLPRQYSQPQYADTKFPVVMVLPGQPSSPQIMYNEFHVGAAASAAIDSGKVKPFVAVIPPIMINPPRDTECVNVPDGPQAESWLTDDVTAAMLSHYRVEDPGKHWSAMGWSTGGLCAAKLALKFPNRFAAAVGFGAEMGAYEDNTTGDLFDGKVALRDQNSPIGLYKANLGTRGAKLLMVVGKADPEAWKGAAPMIALTKGDPDVSVITFPQGGHNDRNYAAYMPSALEWLQNSGALA